MLHEERQHDLGKLPQRQDLLHASSDFMLFTRLDQMTDDTSMRQKIILSVQRALLGNVTSKLRGVSVDWDSQEIRVYCYYDIGITDSDRDIMGDVHTEIATDFVDICPVHFFLIHENVPGKINGHKYWIYLRKE